MSGNENRPPENVPRRAPHVHLIPVKHPAVVLPDELARMYDFRNVCRICAVVTDHILPLYTDGVKFDLAAKIRKYLPIKVNAAERMPQGICGDCAAAVLSWHELYRSARLADFMLRRRLDATDPVNPMPRPSESAGSEVTKDGVKYVDASTEAPELPPERRCGICSLMLPAKKLNNHMHTRHGSVTFRCEECHSYLDKDDLLFHIENHAFERLPEDLQVEYYKNEEDNLEEEAKIDAMVQVEVERISHYFRRKEQDLVHEQADIRKRRMIKSMNIQPSKELQQTNKKITTASKPPKEPSKSDSDEVKREVSKVARASIDTETSKKKLSEGTSETPREQDSDLDRSPLKRKRIYPKQSPDTEPSPAKRLRKNKRVPVTKNERKAKEFDDRDDGNDGDDEVNTPKTYQSTKAIKAKDEGSDKSPKTSRTCPICGKQYRASSSYFYHMKYFHKRSREHECLVCNKKFGTKANLAQHASIHTGAYDLECKECGKRFKSKPSLYIHEQSHGGPKRWACAQCGRSFRWRTHLARHVTRHAAERAHVCSTCGRGFSVRCDLLRHARTHAADEFHCATCGLKFAQKRYLQVHVVKKHSEAISQVVTRS